MTDVSFIPEAAWREAQGLAEVVHPLAERDRWPRHLVQASAAALGITRQTLYCYADPNGLLRSDGEKLLGRTPARSDTVPSR